jgi:5-hydroxyisourate hydrolase-like protein (transthyretin family)
VYILQNKAILPKKYFPIKILSTASKTYQMKHLTRKSSLIFIFSTFVICAAAQLFFHPISNYKIPPPGKDPYKKYWAEVDSLEQIGLTETANKVVQKIMTLSKSDGNSVQLIKSFFYQSKYRDVLEEESFATNMQKLDELIKTSQSPVKELLYSIKGEVTWNKYQADMWQINQRTPIDGDTEPDMDKWDAKRFAREAMKCYELSLLNPKDLQKTKMDAYAEILMGDSTFRNLKPTLYDFVMHRAIDFYQSSYLDMLEPAEKFEIDNEKYFELGDLYMGFGFEAKDSASSLLKAIKLYQQLYQFHKNDEEVGTLVQLELNRLGFIGKKSVLDNKEQLYLEAVKKLVTKYENQEVVADVYFVLAQVYFEQSGNWTPKGDEPFYREYRKEALRICDLAIQKFPNSDGAHNCRIYKKTIEAPSVSINMKKAQVSKTNILASVSYKNIDKLFVKVYRHDYDKVIGKLTYYETQDVAYNTAKSGVLVKQMSFNLKAFEDYFDHTTEIAVEPLDLGFYTLTFSTKESDADTNSFNGFTSFWSTDIGVLDMTSYNGGGQFFHIINRAIGVPIAKAQVGVYKLKYNYETYLYQPEKIKSVSSDKQGMVKEAYKNGESYFLDIKNGKDRFVTENFYSYNYGESYPTTEEVRFFLDRGIYRPGQTINFKLIAVKNNKKDFTILPNQKIKVRLFDINYKLVSELEVTTNDFGTASGSFVIPTSVAAGGWSMTCEHGSTSLQVEEYKRPKFEVNVDSIPGSCALNDVIKVRGSAKALAGFGISDADVTYKVDRLTQMYIYDYRYYQRNSGSKTITTGKMKTNEKGEFEFSFVALPDLKVKEKYDPYFTYTVTVDVTDLSGETRSTSFAVVVARKTMTIASGLPYYLSKADTNQYEFSATNLSGFAIFTKGIYEIKKVKTPPDYMVDRPFAMPDEPLMGKDEFKKKFPHYAYTDEDVMTNWELGEVVATGNFDTELKTTLKKDTWNQLPQGWYKITTKAKDSKGVDVSSEAYFMLYDQKEKSYPFQQFATCQPIKTYCKQGEKGEILLGSSVEHGVFNIVHEYDGRIIKVETVPINREQKLLSFPICADKSTPYILHIYMVNDNHVFSTDQYFYLDDDSDYMEFELVTFRDKLLPGQDETWKVKLKGNKKQDIAGAEVLANMYDASLDELFYPNTWNSYFGNYHYTYYNLGQNNFNTNSNAYGYNHARYPYDVFRYKSFECLNYFGWSLGYNYGNYRYGYFEDDLYSFDEVANVSMDDSEVTLEFSKTTGNTFSSNREQKEDVVTYGWTTNGEANAPIAELTGGMKGDNTRIIPPAKVRTNFNETAFFYPHLITDDKGEVSFSFKVPESLTKWKFRAMAITKDLKSAYVERMVVTQKQVMITAFAPRFVREGDKIFFSAKVTNLTDKDMTATAELDLKDAIQDKQLDLVASDKKSVAVDLKAGESKKVEWYFEVPKNLQALTYRIIAKTEAHSDGEENTIPVLSNRILVTEAVPLNVRGDSSKTYTFKNLVNSANSNTLEHERLTLEVTANPAWYAIQALPYMMEYPYECAEQTFNRYYANAIGAHIANSDPRIKKVFEIWKNYQPDALLSNLEKNEELKQILIEETPWLRDAKNETERKRRVGILFDLNRMDNEASVTINKLAKMQLPNGGWPWFDGGPDSRYITQYIVSGMGHLKKLGVDPNNTVLNNMMVNALAYLDNQIKRDYDDLIKWKVNLEQDNISGYHIQYLYARSFFKEIEVKQKDKLAYDYYYGQAEKYWLNKGIYMQGMIALAHNRGGNITFATKVVKSLGENAVKSDEMGMYWKQTAGWYWYEAPIETQALLIETFDEVANDQVAVEEMKIWLLKNKQTNDWKTTKATADACYVLLLKGTNLLSDEPEITIDLGSKSINSKDPLIVKEAGTGYFKMTIPKSDIKSEMGNIKISKKGSGISWGAVYWQYFENIDKIPASMNNLQVNKRLFRKVYTKTGNTLETITDKTPLKIGDRLTVRLELKVDRDMEYVHIKDMRASALEPENVISMYKYREGLAYYQSTRDVATNFFIEFMPKGSYVFEYNLRVTHAGEFSNGLTTIQCMYAPEFTSHTPGMNIKTVE